MRVMRALALVVVLILTALTAPPAAAAHPTLCTGFAACAAAGYRSHGYQHAMATSWWRQAAGHNCTNYAAYRLIHTNGMSTTKPWSTFGNARTWGHANAHLTNNTPALGSIAWWDSGVGPASSSGHLGYVERIVSANEIWVSEDNFGGNFHWRRVTREGGSWPSGFIHFADLPANAAHPRNVRVAGTAPESDEMTLSWTAPTAGPLTGYRVTWTPSTGGASRSTTVTSPQATLTGLELGRSHQVVIAVLGVGGATSGATAAASVTSVDFNDVSPFHVFAPEIAWLSSTGITTGYTDGGFRPRAPVLREQMAAFLYRQAGSPPFEAPELSPFADVDTSHTFYREIAWLADREISTGYAGPDDDRTFRPSAPVLREQMAAFLYRHDHS